MISPGDFLCFFLLMRSGLRTKGYAVSEVVRVQSRKFAGPRPVHSYPVTQLVCLCPDEMSPVLLIGDRLVAAVNQAGNVSFVSG